MRKKPLLKFLEEKKDESKRLKDMSPLTASIEERTFNTIRNSELNGRICAYQEIIDYLSV